jgi:hypothetical protein
MWPWEHVAAGYLAYSLFARVAYGRAPLGDATLAVVAAALLPDLIDKPLAWGAHLLPSGRSLAHSLFFAGPAIVATGLLVGRRVAIAFALTYLGHLGADAVYPMALGQPPVYHFLLWPLLELPPTETPGLLFRTRHLFGDFLEFLETPRGRLYLLVEGTLLGSAAALWVLDGRPGVGTVAGWLSSREEPRGT